MKRLAFLSIVVSVFALQAVGPSRCAAQDLRIYCMDVEQGDGTVIITPGNHAVVIDAGRNDGLGTEMADFIRLGDPAHGRPAIGSISYLFTTHYDSDHIAGMDTLIRGIPVAAAYDRGEDDAPTVHYTNYVGELRDRGVPRHELMPGDRFDLDGVSFTCLCVNGRFIEGPPAALPADDNLRENTSSAGFLVSYGDFDFLVLGDLPAALEETVGAMFTSGRIDRTVEVHHVSHHGAETSSTRRFLDALQPEVAVISVGGTGNTVGYNHPRQVTIDNLYDAGVLHIYQTNQEYDRVYRDTDGDGASDVTIVDGDILIETDGSALYRVNGDEWGDPGGGERYSIRGRVLHARSGAGIRGVEVGLSPEGAADIVVETDAAGRYEFADLRAGNYAVAVSADAGYSFDVSPDYRAPRGNRYEYRPLDSDRVDQNFFGFSVLPDLTIAGVSYIRGAGGKLTASVRIRNNNPWVAPVPRGSSYFYLAWEPVTLNARGEPVSCRPKPGWNSTIAIYGSSYDRLVRDGETAVSAWGESTWAGQAGYLFCIDPQLDGTRTPGPGRVGEESEDNNLFFARFM